MSLGQGTSPPLLPGDHRLLYLSFHPLHISLPLPNSFRLWVSIVQLAGWGNSEASCHEEELEGIAFTPTEKYKRSDQAFPSTPATGTRT